MLVWNDGRLGAVDEPRDAVRVVQCAVVEVVVVWAVPDAAGALAAGAEPERRHVRRAAAAAGRVHVGAGLAVVVVHRVAVVHAAPRTQASKRVPEGLLGRSALDRADDHGERQ